MWQLSMCVWITVLYLMFPRFFCTEAAWFPGQQEERANQPPTLPPKRGRLWELGFLLVVAVGRGLSLSAYEGECHFHCSQSTQGYPPWPCVPLDWDCEAHPPTPFGGTVTASLRAAFLGIKRCIFLQKHVVLLLQPAAVCFVFLPHGEKNPTRWEFLSGGKEKNASLRT